MKFLSASFVLPFVAAVSLFAAAPRVATPASEIAVPKDFKVELVRSAGEGEGTWIAVCKDNKGRLIISPQDARQPLLRATLTDAGAIGKMEKIELPIGESMGMLYAFDSLYVSGKGGERRDVLGLYRLTDTNGDDQFDKIELLKKFDGAGGEHGSHALELGPDGKIYYIHGNFVKVPSDVSADSPHKHYADDVLLPRGEDGNGFGRGLKPPGGFIMRTDKEGKNWEMVAGGMRNTYDFAINADGEILCFDSDMEWDWSMPWYRPTRIYHLVSGGDYGFREGTAKWPAYYADGLPPALDVGIGSPTGVAFGYGAKFPGKYQNAMFAMDWSYGRIFAIHLTPEGATYRAEKETFVRGKPLNVTDMVVGNDGALYFMTGGRGTQSGLYRVTYAGNEETAPVAHTMAGGEARALRKKLEAFHGRKDAAALGVAWPHLNSDDRWVRYAARIAVESQDPQTWSIRALEEESVNGGLTALLALARVGNSEAEQALVTRLGRLRRAGFNDDQMLMAVRVLEVAMARMGRPNSEVTEGIVRALNPLFPSGKPQLDRELAQVLLFLEAPDAVERCLTKGLSSPIFEDQMYYMFHLRTIKTGWTRPMREQYFGWFNQKHTGTKHPAELVNFFTEAGREYSDGASFPKFIDNAKVDAFRALSDQERTEIAPLIAMKPDPNTEKANEKPAPKPITAAAKNWQTSDFAPLFESFGKMSYNFQRGKQAYTTAQCLTCHRMRDEGGAVGPDLTAIAQRFTPRDILESITEPSKVVSDQYAGTDFTLKNGDEVSGRIIEENDQKFVVLTNPLNNGKTDVKKSDLMGRKVSKLSPMPEGLINGLSKEEVMDLIAYLAAAGQDKHPLFQPRN